MVAGSYGLAYLDQAVERDAAWLVDMQKAVNRMRERAAEKGEIPVSVVEKAIESSTEITLEESRILDSRYMYWSTLEVRSVFLEEPEMLVDGSNVYSPEDPIE